MAIGLSIHIGLNEIDARHYGSPCNLSGCVGDANAMRALAVAAGFEPAAMLLGPAATAQAVLDAIHGASTRIGGDDILLLTYSGHGGQVRDVSGDEGGPRNWDETWCLYDRQLIDDELKECWGDFAAGARVLVVSDSCFSGDMIRLAPGETSEPLEPAQRRALWDAEWVDLPDEASEGADLLSGGGLGVREARVTRGGGVAMRALTSRVARRIYNRHYALYDRIQREVSARPQRPIEARVLLLAASQDNEPAQDGDQNGAFTAALLEAWNGGAFDGSYRTFYQQIRKRLVPKQHPAILALQPPAFADQRPFTI